MDAFVSKLNAAGSALAYSTYLGGTGSDEGGHALHSLALFHGPLGMVCATSHAGNAEKDRLLDLPPVRGFFG